MRRLILTALLGAAVATAATLSGCPAAHSDYPGTSCRVDSDCFQGEVCQNNTICVPNLDMSVIGDFAHPSPDLSGDDMMPMDDMTPVDL
jgi:hypothetical protein